MWLIAIQLNGKCSDRCALIRVTSKYTKYIVSLARPNCTDVANLGEELWYMCAWMIHDVCKENSSIIMSNARSLEWLNYHEMCACVGVR